MLTCDPWDVRRMLVRLDATSENHQARVVFVDFVMIWVDTSGWMEFVQLRDLAKQNNMLQGMAI